MGSVTVELSGVTDTVAIVTGLTPGASYIFSVTAENAVSSQDINTDDRTVNITVTTYQGGEQMHSLQECSKIHMFIQYLLELQILWNTVLLWFGDNLCKLMVQSLIIL